MASQGPGSGGSAHGGGGGHAGTGGGGGGGGGGHSGGGESWVVAAAARQLVTDRQMTIFAASLCGIMGIFVLLHWIRFVFNKTSQSSCASVALASPFGAVTRAIRRLFIRKVPGFNSAGHALVVTAYVGINAAVLFTNVDLSKAGNIGSRTGWLATGNMCLAVFLALKNTPLAFLTAYSYERLNCLHQISGYTMFLSMVIHAVTYTGYFANKDKLWILVEKEQIAGIISGFAFLSVTVSAMVLRRAWYELFYVVHVSFFIVGTICACFHRPEFSGKAIIAFLFAASLWVADRLIRLSRALYYASNNTASLYPLPNGGTRVVIKKVSTRSVPGKHFFIWIPAVRLFEMHPFTIVGTQPLEFFINSHNGFTRELHRFALANPGVSLRASVDGPYGTFPDPMEYDKVVLIAGGSGASFTFGLAVNLLERMTETSTKSIVFIWAVRQHDNITWFTQHLETLRRHDHSGKVNISLYVTRSPVSPEGRLNPQGPYMEDDDAHAASSYSSLRASPTEFSPDAEKQANGNRVSLPPIAHQKSTLSDDIEKDLVHESKEYYDHNGKGKGTHDDTPLDAPEEAVLKQKSQGTLRTPRVTAGRPDTATMIREIVSSTPASQRVLVAACGPQGLMKVTRDTTAKVIRASGPAVELHCEQFGW